MSSPPVAVLLLVQHQTHEFLSAVAPLFVKFHTCMFLEKALALLFISWYVLFHVQSASTDRSPLSCFHILVVGG